MTLYQSADRTCQMIAINIYLGTAVRVEPWAPLHTTPNKNGKSNFLRHATCCYNTISLWSGPKSFDFPSASKIVYAANYGGTYASGNRHTSNREGHSHIRFRRAPDELAALKKRTKCMRCGKSIHWRDG